MRSLLHERFGTAERIRQLPSTIRRIDLEPEELIGAYCLALGPGAFKLLFGTSLVCNHCERVVTIEDLHICVSEEQVMEHVSYVLRDRTGIIPAEVLQDMIAPLFSRALYAGAFESCRWHAGNYTVHKPL